MAKFITIRYNITVGAAKGWELYQINIQTSFLNGALEVEIYMEQPNGFRGEGNEHLMCKFIKPLYGLKQLLRAWYHPIDSFFMNESFCMSKEDHPLYIKQWGVFYGGNLLC